MSDFTEDRFSAKSVEYETPQAFFDALDVEFHFTLDVAASIENAKCLVFYTRDQDGLSQSWTGTCWCNPPYGRDLPRWIRKAVESARAGTTTVMLIPARTNTNWWHDLVMVHGVVRFVRGRLRFNGGRHGLPFPLAVVVIQKSGGLHPTAAR